MPLSDRYLAGFSTLEAGMNGGISPALIGMNQYSAGVNVTVRDGYVKTRPPWTNRFLNTQGAAITTWTGIFQGHAPYNDGQGKVGWVVSRGGYLFFVDAKTYSVTDITPIITITVTEKFTVPALHGTVNVFVTSETPFTVGQSLVIDVGSYTVAGRAVNELILTYNGGAANATVAQGTSILSGGFGVTLVQPNPPNLDFVFIFQAENYAVVLAGQNQTIIWDGGNSRRTGVNEIPPGYIGAYGWGRIWIGLANRLQFVAGDLVGGPSGTPQKGNRDAILKFTENSLIAGGGAFAVPLNAGLITSMQFLATQDTSLGIGVLLVGTTNMVFSVNAPVDRTTWQNLTYPIQTVSLIDYGPQAPYGSVSVNGDMWYRSLDGFRSFIVARRNFPTPGNTPLSREISPIIDFDQPNLVSFGSGMLFDNRLLMTVSPFRNTDNSVIQRGLVAINFDVISNLGGKGNPAWEGVWTGLDIYQVSKLLVDGDERGFAFVRGSDDVQLWELEQEDSKIADAFVSFPGDSISETPIAAWIETRAENFNHPDELKNLFTAAIYIHDIAGTIPVTIKYRPDQYPDWITWKTFTLCAENVEQCTVTPPGVTGCVLWKPFARLYAARIMLPRPADQPCLGGMLIKSPAREAHELQFRLEWTGHMAVRRFEVHAKPRQQPMDGECTENELSCQSFQYCGTNFFTYSVPN